MATKVEAPKMVRFRTPTNRGMVRYRAGELYPADASVQKWLADTFDSDDYKLLDAVPDAVPAEPDKLKPPKKSSRLASSRRKGKGT